MKVNSLIIILIIMASGAGFVLGQSPIAGLENTISQIETENIALQSQVEELYEDNNDIQELLVATLANLSTTQSAYQNLYENFTEIQHSFVHLLTSYEEVKNHIEAIDFDNSVLLSLYSSLWHKYADLIVAYNNLAPTEPIGQMVVTEIPGIVNGDWENGNEGWLTQGVSNLVGGVKYLHKHDRGTFTTQSVTLTNKTQGLQFSIKPQPFGGEISLEVSIKDVVIYIAEYTEINSQFNWEIITLPFKPLMNMREQYGFPIMDIYDIRFTVLAGEDTGANIALDNVSLIEIQYVDYQCDMYINEGFEFEIMDDGVAEWTNEVSYYDYDIIKLMIPEGARVGTGAVVKSPLDIPFSSLESFSYCVSFDNARPRFQIYLDTNEDDTVDTILRSDYQDFGTEEWSFATGGLRWGWSDPIGPWESLAYWRNVLANAQVMYVGVYLEYWGAHPEGIGEPLYVANYVCVNTF